MTATRPATPPRRTRLSRDQRAEQLLDVAERLFADQGFEGTSMEDVARAAGVTRPVVYDHHATKEDLFYSCVRRARRELEDRLDALQPSGQVDALADVLECGGDAFFGILERDPRRWAVLFNPSSALAEPLARRLEDLRAGTIERIAAVARRFAPDADPDRLGAYAHAISGVGEQLGRWWLTRPDVPRQQVVAYYRDFVVSGLTRARG
ncbi:TetR/AcrR family transcriptional regulator [Blastococcus sp. URHD0036]|uniref:TetR/AcrR family transcriptional regulator n=1 Tax=Blastococcus sp. URHD0036 TaxID=1380356 RepID=UPI000494DFDC|nr:TetR/AcrR family transcriptional regulator [Blastococcus sp. URHD0036]